ncbi:MAG: neuromedin U [Planctomycetota bacterium]|jgi:hypothetical protein
MRRNIRIVATLAAALVGAGAFAPPATAGRSDAREAEAIARAGLETMACERAYQARRAPWPRDAVPAWSEIQRAQSLRGLVDRSLREADARRADDAASTTVLSGPDFSVSLAAFQDAPPEDAPPDYTPPARAPLTEYEDGSETVFEYQDDIDYNADGVVSEGDLARAAQNPIADLISLPFQNNTNIDFGNLNYEQNVLNIQPVIPFNLNEDWNLIIRTIVPIIYQPAIFSGDDHDFGVGDIQFTAFLTPTKTFGGWLIGGGPVMRAPTASDERLGARKWALGPSAVFLRLDGPWVIGSLFQQVWSVAGSGDNNVSEFLWQPFINYNIPEGKGWYLTTSPIITANWQADSSDQWTIPLGGGAGRVFRMGDQPVNVSLQGFYNVEKPDVVGDWTIRFQFQFLFPRG